MNFFRKCDVSHTSTLRAHTDNYSKWSIAPSLVRPASIVRAPSYVSLCSDFRSSQELRNAWKENHTPSNLDVNSTFRPYFPPISWACPCCYKRGNSSTDRLSFTRGITPFEKMAYTNGRWSIKWPSNHGEENLQIERRASPCSSTYNTNAHVPIKKGTPFINKLFPNVLYRGDVDRDFQCNCRCVNYIPNILHTHIRGQVKRRSFLSSCLLVSFHIFITIMGGSLEQLKVVKD
jgi:hypothetical protein